MARTFVRVELEHETGGDSFAAAMSERGFVRTVKGKLKHTDLMLPDGMYLIEGISPGDALKLTRAALLETSTRGRVFCLPVEGEIRFSNLQPVAG